ncbi:terminase small subunit [Stappia sp.]|uniref:terminase small subunit n=1 Tax=Stappia sp. TaxID=1870903 RepID=UPI003C7EA6D8
MPALKNARHEAFAQALAKGASAADAYVQAGYKASRSAASRLSANVNIEARVSELVQRIAEKAEWSAADRLRTLSEIVERTATKDPRVAVSAIAEANKMQGSHAPAKTEVGEPGGWEQGEDKTWRQRLRGEKG